ncbi:hypothetical protein M3Y96_01095800 [Aphelenchoides besseyi]|nr:hypothetical protein M3Y96_01095800 [Aphelenchoides besseyi]
MSMFKWKIEYFADRRRHSKPNGTLISPIYETVHPIHGPLEFTIICYVGKTEKFSAWMRFDQSKTNEDHVSTSPAISTTPVSSTPISTTPSTEKNKDGHSTREVAKKQSDSMMGTMFVPVENQHPAVSPASSSSKSRSKKKTATVETAETLTKEDPEPAAVQLSKERTVRKETNPDTAPAVMVVPELKSARELEEFVVKSSKRKKKSTDSHKAKRSVEESPRERPSKAVDEDQQNRHETRRKTSTQNAPDTLLADSPQPPTLGNDVLGFSVYAYKNRNNDRENA